MFDSVIELEHSELVAYFGMLLILMALGSGLLAVRAYLIDEWAFFILEVAWFAAAALGLWSLGSALRK